MGNSLWGWRHCQYVSFGWHMSYGVKTNFAHRRGRSQFVDSLFLGFERPWISENREDVTYFEQTGLLKPGTARLVFGAGGPQYHSDSSGGITTAEFRRCEDRRRRC